MLRGKGFYIWQIQKCGSLDARTLAKQATDAGLGHVLVKIADGDETYPIPDKDTDGSQEQLTREVIEVFRAAGLQVGGWGFFYGGGDPAPAQQAQRFAARLKQFDLDEAVINAEHFGKQRWRAADATTFMQALVAELQKNGMGSTTLYLSSYRYMRYHPDFPFKEFMDYCHAAMPQVYWVAKNGGDPVPNLQDAYADYSKAFPDKPFLPTGAAYGEMQAFGDDKFYWEATPDQVKTFLDLCKDMKFEAVNFWVWESAWKKRALWDEVAAYTYPVSTSAGSEKSSPAADSISPPVAKPLSAAALEAISIGDDGVALIRVNSDGYQQGVYQNCTDAGATTFMRQSETFAYTATNKQRSTIWAQWSPFITESGDYLIEALIPGQNATTSHARYHIYGVDGQPEPLTVELNQDSYFDTWVTLGRFKLDASQPYSGMVSLNNLTIGETAQKPLIAFGPIRWNKLQPRGAGVPAGYCDGFDAPVGDTAERAADKIWPGAWRDANPFLNYYFLGYHTGADLNLNEPRYDADRGAPAYSIADGVVIYSGKAYNADGSPSGFGTLVIVKHDPYQADTGETVQVYSRYAHMKDLAVEKGQRVQRGDQVGKIWNNGTEAYHLHFDICTTNILETRPGHWPGNSKSGVIEHYTDPGAFIRKYRPKRG